MKKRWLVLFLTMLVALVLAACGTNVDNGKIDDIDELPVKVEVAGLEGVTGRVEAAPLSETQQAEALSVVKNAYYVADGAETYAVDIKILDTDGKEITVGKPVTVSITLPDTKLPLDKYVVFHIHDGKADEIVPTVAGGKLTFTVESFSHFVVVPAHEHTFGEWTFVGSEPDCGETVLQKRTCVCGKEETRDYTGIHHLTHHASVQATCTADGVKEYYSCAKCGKNFTDQTASTEIAATELKIAALDHVDVDRDGKCDRCGFELNEGGNGGSGDSGSGEGGGETAHTHAFGEWTIKKDATCTENGYAERTCACGETQTKQIDALGHIDEIKDGKCDRCGVSMGEEDPDDLPCNVDVVGANGSVLTADVQALGETDKANALALIDAKYGIPEGATTYAVDITVKNAPVGVPVRVSIELKDPALSLDQYAVYHVHDGDVEMILPEVSGSSLVFTVDSFSPFIIGPKHLHQPSTLVEDTPATCDKDGVGHIECIKCHATLKTQTITALGHVDEDEDGKCDRCGATMQETPDSPIAYVEGKVFIFDHATGEGVNNATYATAYADATMTFFADNYMEYHVYKGVRAGTVSDNNVVLCGTYAIQDDTDTCPITLTVTKRYYDDEETMIPFPTYTFVYDKATATIAVTEYPATIYYSADPKAKPAHYEQPALADNWNDQVIKDAFYAVGAKKDYTFPKLDNVLTMTKSEVVNDQVTVTIVMASKMQGAQAAANYKAYLEYIYYDYTWNNAYNNLEVRVNTDDNLFWFIIATGTVEEYAALTIKISRFYPDYPDAGINNCLTDNEIDAVVPLFMTDWAMRYSFSTEASPAIACLTVTLRYIDGVEQHDEDVAAAFKARLQAEPYNYHEEAYGGKTYLFSPNDQLLLRVVTGKVGNSVGVFFFDSSLLYPADAIAAYLEGTDDTFIDLDDDSVTGYGLYNNEADNPTGLRLVGKLPYGADAHALVSGFEAAFADAGYKWGGFSTHFGAEDAETLRHHAWISPDKEIAVMFAAFNKGEHEFGYFAYYSVSIVNLTAIAPANKALMTSLSAAGYSAAVDLGAPYTFNGNICYMYTNQKSGLEGGGMYTNDLSMVDVGTIDTSIPGPQTLRISLKGNADIYTDVSILVYALTSIDVTTTKEKIDGRVVYYDTRWIYESTYTVTKHFSDGTNITVKGNDESVTFGTIAASPIKQDLTVSCTVKGVTVSTTVPIALCKSISCTCDNEWNINADSARFALYVQGGTYGDGAWVYVNVIDNGRDIQFRTNIYMDATSLYFVRLNPAYDVFGETVYDIDSECVWNKSALVELPDGAYNGSFSFLG